MDTRLGQEEPMPKLKDKNELEQELDEIVRQNKDVDPDQLREARESLRELRKRGHRRPTYGLVQPYERRLLHKSESHPARDVRIR